VALKEFQRLLTHGLESLERAWGCQDLAEREFWSHVASSDQACCQKERWRPVGAGVLFCLLLALLASFRRRRMGICIEGGNVR